MTLALVLPKQGFRSTEARVVCGEIEVAGIGVPAWVLAQAGVTVPDDLFSRRAWLPWTPDAMDAH
jgi:hypothetical protein